MPDSQSDAEPPSTHALTFTTMDGEDGLPGSETRLQVLFEPGDESVPEGLTETFMQECCRTAFGEQSLLSLKDVAVLELSVQLLDTQAMRELNRQYRHKDRPTNVLSFASELPLMLDEPDPGPQMPAGGLLVLGDLVLCAAVIAEEAREQDKPLLHHWAHMLVHGCLHLCGHDHEVEAEAQLMEAAEIRILSELGIPDPYAVENAVNGQ
ncbi:rRNA maturation RNase YbeY [Granulosicoccus sp. 3-233]|uniref:rRNA maturation RNase YbeY n=1 Tax=Granulosicoccus sp. 3-233 TaxID=3417969 RepID=UPI003D34DEED